MCAERSVPNRPPATESRFEAAASRLGVGILFTMTGGFLDAFTFFGHGHVFANAMTGNLVLLGVSAASGDWPQAQRHVPPLLAFLVAVFVAHLAQLPPARRRLREPALACLLLEVAFLTAAASLTTDLPDLVLIPCISFVATLQTTMFVRLAGQPYSSVLATGNLRALAQNLFAGTIPHRDPAALRRAWLFGAVSVCFLAGALLGAFSTLHWPDRALWIAVALLCGALLQIVRLRGG
jgi:uncharacterized membrane protein YoaK (UPF0700 family)